MTERSANGEGSAMEPLEVAAETGADEPVAD